MYATQATPARRSNRPRSVTSPRSRPSSRPTPSRPTPSRPTPSRPAQSIPATSASNKTEVQQLRRSTRRQALAQRKHQQRMAELRRETLIKLSVNGILIAVSVAALAKLVPSLWTQQSQLKEIRSELVSTQTRVGRLRSDFNRTFDPMQSSAVMQQQSYRTDPNQKPVVWVEPGTSTGFQQP